MNAEFDPAAVAAEAVAKATTTEAPEPWGEPDLAVLRLARRAPADAGRDAASRLWLCRGRAGLASRAGGSG